MRSYTHLTHICCSTKENRLLLIWFLYIFSPINTCIGFQISTKVVVMHQESLRFNGFNLSVSSNLSKTWHALGKMHGSFFFFFWDLGNYYYNYYFCCNISFLSWIIGGINLPSMFCSVHIKWAEIPGNL